MTVKDTDGSRSDFLSLSSVLTAAVTRALPSLRVTSVPCFTVVDGNGFRNTFRITVAELCEMKSAV